MKLIITYYTKLSESPLTKNFLKVNNKEVFGTVNNLFNTEIKFKIKEDEITGFFTNTVNFKEETFLKEFIDYLEKFHKLIKEKFNIETLLYTINYAK